MRKYISLISGTLLMALALNVFIEPNSLVTGGASGLAVIFEHLGRVYIGFPVPLWFTNLAVNIPLFIWAWLGVGKKFTADTAVGTVLLSLFLALTDSIPPTGSGDIFINAMFGGAIMGAGVGLVLSGGASTGGSDLLASIINKKYNYLNLAALIFLTDFSVILLGLFVFGITKAMYSIAAIYVSSYATNLVLEGLNFARVVFIMSDKAEEVCEALMGGLERGVTVLYGKGAYTGREKHVIMTVVSRRQVSEVKKIVNLSDPDSFMFVTDVREVMGDFSQIRKKHYI